MQGFYKRFLSIIFFFAAFHFTYSVHAANGIEQTQPVKFHGTFIQSLQQSESITADGTSYHLFDKHNVLANSLKAEIGYYKKIEVCVLGDVSQKGNYGHMGAYSYQLTVTGLCE